MILGVSFDTEQDNRAFAEKYDFNFPLLCDTERMMGMAYGACSKPEHATARRIGVIVDPEGRVHDYEPKAHAQNYPEEALAKIG